MRDLHHTGFFTVFGGCYPAETPSSNPAPRKRGAGYVGPLVPVLVALVLGVATTAGAIAATKRIQAMGYGFQTAGRMENLTMPGLREVLW